MGSRGPDSCMTLALPLTMEFDVTCALKLRFDHG